MMQKNSFNRHLLMLIFIGSFTLAGCHLSAIQDEKSEDSSISQLDCSGLQPMLQTTLWFGRKLGDGRLITQQQWQGFIDNKVTPRFPNGLSILNAQGQFQGANQRILHEPSYALVLIYKNSSEERRNIQAVRKDYQQLFSQESVLQVNMPVCAGF